MAHLARRYLGIPATSVPSEITFCTAALAITMKRASLDLDTAGALIFLSRNMKMKKKDTYTSESKLASEVFVKQEPIAVPEEQQSCPVSTVIKRNHHYIRLTQ